VANTTTGIMGSAAAAKATSVSLFIGTNLILRMTLKLLSRSARDDASGFPKSTSSVIIMNRSIMHSFHYLLTRNSKIFLGNGQMKHCLYCSVSRMFSAISGFARLTAISPLSGTDPQLPAIPLTEVKVRISLGWARHCLFRMLFNSMKNTDSRSPFFRLEVEIEYESRSVHLLIRTLARIVLVLIIRIDLNVLAYRQ
jgi:hypothetical protein